MNEIRSRIFVTHVEKCTYHGKVMSMKKNVEFEMLNFPEYRLGELIYIWKALQAVEQIAVEFTFNQEFSTSVL